MYLQLLLAIWIINSLASGRRVCNLRPITFKLLWRIFIVSISGEIATEPYWCWVNIASGNSLVPSGDHHPSRCWPCSMLLCGVTWQQWVKVSNIILLSKLNLLIVWQHQALVSQDRKFFVVCHKTNALWPGKIHIQATIQSHLLHGWRLYLINTFRHWSPPTYHLKKPAFSKYV